MTKAQKEKHKKVNKIYKAVYDAVDIKSFGWINCDHFLEEKNLTDVYVNINSADSVSDASMYLVFTDINSVMQDYYFKSKQHTYNEPFKNIPVGYKVKLVAYTIKNEKLYTYSSNITVQNKQTINITLKPTPESEFATLLNSK